MSCWPLTLGQCGPFITAQCLIWTVSHKTPGCVTQCHLNQDWLELSLAFAFPPSSPLAFFPGRFMNNEWGYMQAGAQILMEQKNRRRTILCAASHCFHTLPKLPLLGQGFFFYYFFLYLSFSFLIPPFLPSAAGGPRWDNAHSLFLSCLEIVASFLAVTVGAKGWRWLWNEKS